MPLTHFDFKREADRSPTSSPMAAACSSSSSPTAANMAAAVPFPRQGAVALVRGVSYSFLSLRRARGASRQRSSSPGIDPPSKRRSTGSTRKRPPTTPSDSSRLNTRPMLEANGAAGRPSKRTNGSWKKLAPPIAPRPIAEITPAELLDLLQRIERSGRRETARRMRGHRLGIPVRDRHLACDKRPYLGAQRRVAPTQHATPRRDHRREEARRPLAIDRRVRRMADIPGGDAMFAPSPSPARAKCACATRRDRSGKGGLAYPTGAHKDAPPA